MRRRIVRRIQTDPVGYANELDDRLTNLLEPVKVQLREHLAFLEHLSREGDRDYRIEFAIFWAGRNIERNEAAGRRKP